MWVNAARLVLLVAAIAALIWAPSDGVVEVAGGVLVGLVFDALTRARAGHKPTPDSDSCPADDQDERARPSRPSSS